MNLADAPISRLESFLTDSSMTHYVDTVVMRTDDGFRAASATGTVDFCEGSDGSIEILAESGDHPLRNQTLDQGIGTEAEVALEGAPLGELATPLAYESIVQYFDAEHAPDAAVMWSPQQMFHDCVGNHGSLGGIQARAPFIAAGPGIRPRGIVPEGTNSHTFEPAPSVAALLSDADVVFINGLKLEDPTLAMAEANMRDDAELIELGTIALPEEDYIFDFSFPEEEGKPNPHLWTDPTYAIEYAEIVREVLSERDPECADQMQENFDAFAAQANELADAVRADQQTVPEGGLKLVTYHDAYAYFADNFGWDVVGAVQPSDFADPTPSEVVTLIEQIRAEGVPTIFGSEVFPSDVLEEVGNETGVRYEQSLRDDDLPGEPGEDNHSWLGLMQYNFATMIEGLGGEAPNVRAVDITSPVPDSADYPQ